MRAHTLSAALAALLLFGLTGCGDDTLATPAPDETVSAVETPSEESSDPDLPTNEDLELFVEAIASDKVASLEAAQAVTQEGSAAAGYLEYYTHNVNAQIDAGLYSSDLAGKIKPLENGFEVCYPGEEHCAEYTDFEGKNGKIVDFHVAEQAVSERLVMGDGQNAETFGGAEVEFIAAYMNASNSHLIVSYNLYTGDEELDIPLITYRSADGRQSESETHYGMFSLSPDSKSSYVAFFPGASLGGEVHLDFYSYETYQDDVVIFEVSEE